MKYILADNDSEWHTLTPSSGRPLRRPSSLQHLPLSLALAPILCIGTGHGSLWQKYNQLKQLICMDIGLRTLERCQEALCSAFALPCCQSCCQTCCQLLTEVLPPSSEMPMWLINLHCQGRAQSGSIWSTAFKQKLNAIDRFSQIYKWMGEKMEINGDASRTKAERK